MKASSMKKEKLPSISVIIPTYNSSSTITECLESVRNQNYPQGKIEILIIDGGSGDNTLNIVKKYKVKITKADPKKQNVEYNKSLGIKIAKNDLLLMLDHDNIFPNKTVLSKMVDPVINYKDVVGVETLRYHYDKRHTMLDRYFALFAVTDPLVHYLEKADRLSYLYDVPRFSDYKDYKSYIIAKFTATNFPTIGANGFLVRRKLLIKEADTRPGNFFPIDVNVDLVRKGFNKFAFIKDSITHIAGHGNVIYYLQRRMFFVEQFYLGVDTNKRKSARRYSVFEKRDLKKLIFFILISTTFIIPTIDSIRGFVKIRDLAWFLHPIMCFGFVVIYGYVILKHQMKQFIK